MSEIFLAVYTVRFDSDYINVDTAVSTKPSWQYCFTKAVSRAFSMRGEVVESVEISNYWNP